MSRQWRTRYGTQEDGYMEVPMVLRCGLRGSMGGALWMTKRPARRHM